MTIVDGGEEVELAPDKGQVALALLVLQQVKLALASLNLRMRLSQGNAPCFLNSRLVLRSSL